MSAATGGVFTADALAILAIHSDALGAAVTVTTGQQVLLQSK